MSIPYEKAFTAAEAVALRGAHQDFNVLAGGTDLIAQWRAGHIKPAGFLDISSVEQMGGIVDLGGSIEIGALTSHTKIVSSDIVGRSVPVLSEACGTVGAVQIQNRGDDRW